MATLRTNRIDENAVHDRPITTKLTVGKTALSNVGSQRAALGDLANRGRTFGTLGLKKASNVVTEANAAPAPVIDLKKIKPRVDTHWSGAVPLRSTLQRSTSLRTTAKTGSTTTAVGTAAAALPRLTRSRIGTTATLQTAKLTTVTNTRAKSPEKPTTMRRQESNLTRKSLTKLRAAEAAAKLKDRAAADNVASSAIGFKPITHIEPIAHSQKMLLHFDDVDAGDDENPLLVSEYVNDIFAYLYHLEEKYAIREDHLSGQRDVFPKMRSVLIDWINEVHLQYRFAQETFHMAVSIIDRYLQTVTTTSRQNLQLVGVTALFIASKYEELYPPEVKDFVYITDDTYTQKDVLKMEMHILKKLKFELGCPLSINFLRRYSKVASSPGDTHLMSKYFIELSSIEYSMCHYRPSQIAAASLFISLFLSTNENKQTIDDVEQIWTPTLQHYSTYNGQQLQPLVRQLCDLILNAPTAKLNNVYTKYASMKMNKIAIKTTKYDKLLKILNGMEL